MPKHKKPGTSPRKSNGNGGNNCWYVVIRMFSIRLYDTKTMQAPNNITGAPYLKFSRRNWQILLNAIKNGALGNLSAPIIVQLEKSVFLYTPRPDGTFLASISGQETIHAFNHTETVAARDSIIIYNDFAVTRTKEPIAI